MEFIYCNNCWVVKAEIKDLLFHLTQCGHVFCNTCIDKAMKKCFKCSTLNSISLPLKEPLNEQIEHLFISTPDLLTKVLLAIHFQKNQRLLCFNYELDLRKKYDKIKKNYWTTHQNLKKVYEKFKLLKKEILALEEETEKMSKEMTSLAATFNRATSLTNNAMSSCSSKSSNCRTLFNNSKTSMSSSRSHNDQFNYRMPHNLLNNFNTPNSSSRSCNTPSNYETPLHQIRRSEVPLSRPNTLRSTQSQAIKVDKDGFIIPMAHSVKRSSSSSKNKNDDVKFHVKKYYLSQ